MSRAKCELTTKDDGGGDLDATERDIILTGQLEHLVPRHLLPIPMPHALWSAASQPKGQSFASLRRNGEDQSAVLDLLQLGHLHPNGLTSALSLRLGVRLSASSWHGMHMSERLEKLA